MRQCATPAATELRRGLDDAPPEGTARLPEQARLPRARRRNRLRDIGSGEPPRRMLELDVRRPGDEHDRRAPRPGRASARAARQARHAPALGGPDRVRARARDGRHLHGLQLSGLPLQEAPQGVRREVRGRGPVHRLRQHHVRNQAPGFRRRAAGRHGDDARQPRPGGRRQADQAAQPRLHPEPAEEHLAGARRPLLRRWLALHRAVHALRDGHRVADGSCHRGHRLHGAAVGHLLAGGGVQGQDRAAQ